MFEMKNFFNILSNNKEIIFIGIVHLIVINPLVHILFVGPFLLSILLISSIGIAAMFGYNDIEDSVLSYGILLLTLFSYVIRCIILPIYYSYLERNSENEYIKKFIYNIKTNFKWKLIVLLTSSLLPFSLYDIANNDILTLFNVQLFVISYFVSYLTLYIWWDINKIITKYKNREK